MCVQGAPHAAGVEHLRHQGDWPRFGHRAYGVIPAVAGAASGDEHHRGLVERDEECEVTTHLTSTLVLLVRYYYRARAPARATARSIDCKIDISTLRAAQGVLWLLCVHARHQVCDLCDVLHACAFRAVCTLCAVSPNSCQHCYHEVDGSVKRPQVSASLTVQLTTGMHPDQV